MRFFSARASVFPPIKWEYSHSLMRLRETSVHVSGLILGIPWVISKGSPFSSSTYVYRVLKRALEEEDLTILWDAGSSHVK